MMLSFLDDAECDAEQGWVMLNLLLRLNAGVYTGGRLGPLQIVAQYLKLHLYHQVCQNQPNYVKVKFLHKLSGFVTCVCLHPLSITNIPISTRSLAGRLSEYSKVIE